MPNTYIQQDHDVFLKETSVPGLSTIDTIILDIDGVILDVTGSFRVAISRTTQFYFTEILGWEGKAILVTPAETQFFKLAGGFNNDWELTYAAVLFFLAKSVQFENNNLDFIKNRGKLVKDFTREAAVQGGGLAGAERAIFSALRSGQAEKIRALWDKPKLKQIFQELYAGTGYCRRLYGFDPQLIQENGLIGQEKVLLDADNLKPFVPKIGVITGRTKEEAEVALKLASLDRMISPEAILSDDGGAVKPDPHVLLTIAARLGAKAGVYVGDTIDDLKTVINFKNLKPDDRQHIDFFSAIITQKESEKEMYSGLGADIIARNPNDALIALMQLKQGS